MRRVLRTVRQVVCFVFTRDHWVTWEERDTLKPGHGIVLFEQQTWRRWRCRWCGECGPLVLQDTVFHIAPTTLTIDETDEFLKFNVIMRPWRKVKPR